MTHTIDITIEYPYFINYFTFKITLYQYSLYKLLCLSSNLYLKKIECFLFSLTY